MLGAYVTLGLVGDYLTCGLVGCSLCFHVGKSVYSLSRRIRDPIVLVKFRRVHCV